MKMKKGLLGILAAALVLTVVTTGAMAAGGSWHHGAGTGSGASGSCRAGTCQYVDADGDGVCDNCGTACRYVDADGDGVCDNRGTACRYVDADGDGVCDNRGAACRYVDADGDGVCDNAGACGSGRRACRG